MTKWDKLIGKLEARRKTLVGFRDLVGLFREMDGAHGDMQDIEVLNPLGLKSDQHQFSPNNISRSSRIKDMRITKLILNQILSTIL